MPVVCNPSPEGYLPDNFEELCENDESPDAQKVLGTLHRLIKENTLSLHSFSLCLEDDERDDLIVSRNCQTNGKTSGRVGNAVRENSEKNRRIFC